MFSFAAITMTPSASEKPGHVKMVCWATGKTNVTFFRDFAETCGVIH